MPLALTPISGAASAAKTGGVSTAMETSAWIASVAMRANIGKPPGVGAASVAAPATGVNRAATSEITGSEAKNRLRRVRGAHTLSFGYCTRGPQNTEGGRWRRYGHRQS